MSARPVTDFDRAASVYIRSTAAVKQVGQDELAAKVGINVNTFRGYWRGERSISMGDFRTIVTTMGVRTEEAMLEVERMHRANTEGV